MLAVYRAYTLVARLCIFIPFIASSIAFSQMKFARAEEVQIPCKSDYVQLRWNGALFFSIENNESKSPTICMATRDGSIERRTFEIPNAGYLFIYDVTGSVDGTIAVVGTAISSDSKKGTFVSRIFPDRKDTITTNVYPYVPRKATIASDGSIWTVGWILDDSLRRTVANNVVKSYDVSGKSIKTLVPVIARSNGLSFTPPNTPDTSTLRSSPDRIAWLTSGNEYIEFSLNGQELIHISGPPITEKHRGSVTMAISSENQALVAAQGSERWEVWALSRPDRKWMSVEMADGLLQGGEILGFDNSILVVGFSNGISRRYRKQ